VLGFVITVKGMYHVLILMSITCGRALMGGCVVIVEKITGILWKIRYIMSDSRKKASWYCYACQTYGGGSPNNMTMREHIDAVHNGGIIKMVDAKEHNS